MNASLRFSRWFFVLLFAFGGLPLRAEEPPNPAPPPKPAVRFASEIQQFAAWDGKNSFPQDAVLFVGSSSIRLWPTHAAFPQWPVINRGFGGSYISEVNYYFAQVVEPYRPKVIVLYAGDNDIASGKSPQQVCDDFEAFVKLVRDKFAETPIVFLSIKPSGSRWTLWPKMQEANTLIRGVCEKGRHIIYVDMGSMLLGAEGTPRFDLFRQDQLHLNDAGYELWNKTLAPVIAKLMERPEPKEGSQHEHN